MKRHNTLLKRMIDDKRIDIQSAMKPNKYYCETQALSRVNRKTTWGYTWKPTGCLRLS